LGESKEFAIFGSFVAIKSITTGFKKGWLVEVWIAFALSCVAGADELLEAEVLEVLREVLGKVAPFRIITWQEDGFAAKNVGIILPIGVDFLLDVTPLSVELVVLGLLGTGQIAVRHRGSIVSIKAGAPIKSTWSQVVSTSRLLDRRESST